MSNATEEDIRKAIVPKSDQINADDLLTGPITVTVKAVQVKGGQEQPVWISLEETDKYFRPCKGMSRILVAAWGADSAKYVGRSMTLYCDPTVKWGGMAVGGIRISHMTDIKAKMVMAITVSKANKKPYTVEPLTMAGTVDYSAALKTARTIDELGAAWSKIPKGEQKQYAAVKDARKAELSQPADETIARINACAALDALEVIADAFTEAEAVKYTAAYSKRKGELLDAATGAV